MPPDETVVSLNEAAHLTGISLKQVRRIIDADLLGDSVEKRKGARVIHKRALLGMKLAVEKAEILTLKGRRWLVRHVLDNPEARTACAADISVDLRTMRSDVEQRIASLEKSKKMIASNKAVLGGAPCFKGTRIPVHDIAQMLANGDEVAAILSAYPSLAEGHMAVAAIYAEAYPRRGRRHQRPASRKIYLRDSKVIKLDELSQR